MKFLLFILLSGYIFLLTSCKKEIYGCTDSDASNYSTLATKNDGSCFYDQPAVKSTVVTISNWTATVDSWVTTIPYGEITTDVVDNGAVITYLETGTNTWSALPLLIYNSGTYSTSIQVSVTVGQVIIEYKNSDQSMPVEPGENRFKISAVS